MHLHHCKINVVNFPSLSFPNCWKSLMSIWFFRLQLFSICHFKRLVPALGPPASSSPHLLHIALISFIPSYFILSTLSKNFQTSLFIYFLLVKLGFELSVVLLLVGTLDVGETGDVGEPINSKFCPCSSRMMWSFLWVI